MVLQKGSPTPAKDLELLAIIGHPIRLDIIMALGSQELVSSALADQLDCPRSRVSENLAHLHRAGIVRRRKAGRFHFYELANPDLQQLAALLSDLVAED